jgi:predicted Zn-dependent protease
VELKKALLLEPSYGHVSLHLAIAHLESGNTEEAVAVLESSTCRDWPEALVVAAEALLKSGRRQEAVEAARSAVAVDRSNTDALRLLESMGA